MTLDWDTGQSFVFILGIFKKILIRMIRVDTLLTPLVRREPTLHLLSLKRTILQLSRLKGGPNYDGCGSI